MEENKRILGNGTTLSFFARIQKCRVELQKKDLKKSGENKFAGFKYFELGDILPSINELMDKYELFSVINFTKEEAILTIYDSNNSSDFITFSCPSCDLVLKGCNAIQAEGGKQTYLRRYLYMNAFEIVENDTFDSVTGKDDKLSTKQINRLYAIANKAGITKEQVIQVIKKDYRVEFIDDLTKGQYDEVCNRLEKKGSN